MAGAAPYSYDSTAPQLQPTTYVQSPVAQPAVKVVPGGRSQKNIGVPPVVSMVVRIGALLLAAFVIISLVRIGISSAAYEVASDSSALRASISEAQLEQNRLVVEKSAVANPIALKEQASKKLHMSAPYVTASITLEQDIVAINDQGELSLVQSVKRLIDKE